MSPAYKTVDGLVFNGVEHNHWLIHLILPILPSLGTAVISTSFQLDETSPTLEYFHYLDGSGEEDYNEQYDALTGDPSLYRSTVTAWQAVLS